MSGGHQSASSAASASSASGSASTSSDVAGEGEPSSSQVLSSAAASEGFAGEGAVLEVRFLDVGQGDCALVSCGGHHALIDGGPAQESDKVFTVLRNLGVASLDFVVATHADADHIGGIPAALRQAPTATCYSPVLEDQTETFATMKRYVEQGGGTLVVPVIPTELDLGGARLRIIGPTAPFDNDNDNSLVCRLEFGATSLLFMGDAESSAEQALIASGADLHADVLKVGHHGSANSTSPALVRAVQPASAVISVGADNGYGHPAARVLQTLQDASAVVYRTDQMGDVVAVSDGQRFLFSTGARRATQQHPADASGDAASEGGAAEGTAAEGDAAAAGTSEEAAEAAAQGYKYTSMKQFVDALPEGTAFIGNTRTKKFHSLDCPSVKAMKGKNATALASVEQAHELGYTPCGTCNPG